VVEKGMRATYNHIGLFAAAPSDPFARSLIANGVSDTLRERQSSMQLLWSNYHRFEVEAIPHEEEDISVPTEQLAALMLWPPKVVAFERLLVARKRMPVVMLDRRAPGFESDFVGFRDFEAGYEAARHLFEVGHRKIAFIGEATYETSLNRRLGFERFCWEAGLEPLWGWAFHEYEAPIPSIIEKAWMSMPKTQWPTAAVCTNDETAARMMARLSSYGLSVPEDLALVGFGGAQMALLSALGLTTMEQPYIEIGKAATEIVLNRVDGDRSDYVEVRLPMVLRVRTSCGSGVGRTVVA
jgi:DNA-binding LacI/PurR family transcriptional regulator